MKEKILSSKTQIRFSDCDPFMHLNNARYIDYFLNAREDHLKEHYDISITDQVTKFGKAWVVGNNYISYLKPAKLMETVVIKSSLIDYSENYILIEMSMWDEEVQQLKSIMWTRFFHINLVSKKMAKHNDDFLSLFESVKLDLGVSSFDKRLHQLGLTN